jgi:hypothetical protein
VPFPHRARNIFVTDKAGAVLQEELKKRRQTLQEQNSGIKDGSARMAPVSEVAEDI